MENELLNENLNKLKIKIDALDSYHNGAKIIDIARRLNFSKNNLYYWLEKESSIRHAYSEMREIERLQANDKNLPNTCKEVKEKLENLKQLQKKRSYSVTEKLKCIELVKGGCSVADVSRKSGFNHSLIKNWTKVELKLLQSKCQQKRRNIRSKGKRCQKSKECKLENEIADLSEERNEEIKQEMVTNETLKKNSNIKQGKIDLQTKIEALQMVESGVKISKVAQHFKVCHATVQYWTEKSEKLKEEAEVANICQTETGKSPKELTEIKQTKKAQVISIETKLELFHWKKLFPDLSWEDLGTIFGYHRLLVIGWLRVAHNLISRFRFRKQWRKDRLDRLIVNTNHKTEIFKLKNLLKSENVLDKLSGYLTHGITYTCPKLARRNYSVFHQKVQRRYKTKRQHVFNKAFKPLKCEPSDLASTSPSPPSSELHSIFVELYQEEYEVLLMIDKRYQLFVDQRHICDHAHRSAIDENISLLQSHLLRSIQKLISLHQMMIDP